MLALVILASLAVGCLAIASACFHWVRTQRFGVAGAVLSTVGLVLVGMSVWGSVEFRAPSSELKPASNTAVQQIVADANVKTLAAMKDNGKQLTDQFQQFAQQAQAEHDRVLSDIQSQILAIRTALSERPAPTPQRSGAEPLTGTTKKRPPQAR